VWKRIIVGLDGSEHADCAAEHALSFARRTDAEVEAVFAVDLRLAAPPLPPADMLGAPLDVPAARPTELEAEERRCGEAILARFRERAERERVRATAAIEAGIPAQALLGRARSGDAIFLGKEGRGARGDVGSTVRAVGHGSVRPVFVAPRGFRRAIERVLVAYDGSPEATRALRAAAELAERGGLRFSVLTIEDGDEPAGEVQRTASTYFRAHGIDPECLVRRGRAGPTILACAQEIGADLVVAGSFGAARWREMLLGSVTLELLRGARVPVLIHH
jgi:nucleotide-binding universal stress UspA family protein